METLMWQRAASLAARAHAHQRRKDGETPYVAHPFRVAMTVRDVFGCDDETALTIAVLHDTIEDTTVDYDDIVSEYGAAVADGVAALTKNKTLPEHERETEYDRRLGGADWRARLVKLADTFDNLSDLACFPEKTRGAQLERLRARCGRAIKLAEPDAGEHEQLRRGIEAVRGLLEKCSKR